MKTKLLFLFVIFTLTGCVQNTTSNKGVATAEEYVKGRVYNEAYPWYYNAQRAKHKSEIDKSLTVNEVVEFGDLRVIFYSFSVGADIVRETCQCGVVDGLLYPTYPINRIYEYEDETINRLKQLGISKDRIKELEQVLERAKEWEESNPPVPCAKPYGINFI